LETVQDRR